MGKGSDRSLIRLIVWEGLAFAGFLQIHFHPFANEIWDLNFRYNALFFLVAYPFLYVYRWKLDDGCLRLALWPFGFLFGWLLCVSSYLWIAYLLLLLRSHFFYSMIDHPGSLGFLFIFLYFPILQPLLGVGQRYTSVLTVLKSLLWAGVGGVLGYSLGFWVDSRFGHSLSQEGLRFLVWLGLILFGAALGAVLGQRASSDKK
ncbi:MAG TPA: hypothetical protein VHE12_00910 [bacterium]|nr:hypothetical protein [bacterium]